MNTKKLFPGALLLVTAVLCMAPAGSQPEQISATQPDWDTQSQEFLIGLAADASKASTWERQGYVVRTTVGIQVDDSLILVGPQEDRLRVATSRAARADGMVPLEPQRISWSRVGQCVTGTFRVSVISQLVAPNGRLIGDPATADENVEIKPLPDLVD